MTFSVKKLIDIFSHFPTVGPRTAGRFVFYLMKLPKDQIDELAQALMELKSNIKICQFCFNPYEDGNLPLCSICQDTRRNKELLCVVEKESDLISIENIKKYNGLYFILGGNVGTMKDKDLKNLRVKDLLQRLENPEKFGISKTNFKELIIATNPTVEGNATALIIEVEIKNSNISTNLKITHLAKGLPSGGELEYADQETLESALEGRK